MVTEIPRSALPDTGRLKKLGTGGEGSVYALSVHGAPREVRDLVKGRPLAYKEFLIPDSAREAEHHRSVVEVFGKFGPEQQEWLLDRAAWPVATVTDNGTVTGIVMPLIPDQFFREFPASGGRTNRAEAGIQLLLNDDRYLQKMRLLLSEKQRYSILLEVCDLLRVLHGGGIVVDDLSARNLMFSLGEGAHGAASIHLIDCDSVSTPESVNPNGMETPGWEVPAGVEKQTSSSDRYKFGLLVLRLLAGDQRTRGVDRLPAGTPHRVCYMVGRTLVGDLSDLPTFSEWFGVLSVARGSVDGSLPTAQASPVVVPATGTVSPVSRRKPGSSPKPVVSRTAAPRSSTAAPQAAAAQATAAKPDAPEAAKVVRGTAIVLAVVCLYMLIRNFISVGNDYDWKAVLWKGYLGQLVSWYQIPVLIFSVTAALPGKLDKLWSPLSLRSLALILMVMQMLDIFLWVGTDPSYADDYSVIEDYLSYDGYEGWYLLTHLLSHVRVVCLLVIAVAAFRLKYDKDGELVR